MGAISGSSWSIKPAHDKRMRMFLAMPRTRRLSLKIPVLRFRNYSMIVFECWGNIAESFS